MSNHGDGEDDVGPDDWRRHKPYGAGISRKRINFVKAGSAPTTASRTSASTSSGDTATDVSSFYLNLVLKGQGQAGLKTIPNTHTLDMQTSAPTDKDGPETKLTTNITTSATEGKRDQDVGEMVVEAPFPICDVCSLPIDNPVTHQHTLAHQSSLPHSELPHHFDRSSQGLKYLISRGWDPDKKVGLGKEGAEGERIPMAVKMKPKYDTVGLGVRAKNKDKEKGKGKEREGSGGSGSEKKVVKRTLDAKSARKEAEKEKERRKALADYLNRG